MIAKTVEPTREIQALRLVWAEADSWHRERLAARDCDDPETRREILRESDYRAFSRLNAIYRAVEYVIPDDEANTNRPYRLDAGLVIAEAMMWLLILIATCGAWTLSHEFYHWIVG